MGSWKFFVHLTLIVLSIRRYFDKVPVVKERWSIKIALNKPITNFISDRVLTSQFSDFDQSLRLWSFRQSCAPKDDLCLRKLATLQSTCISRRLAEIKHWLRFWNYSLYLKLIEYVLGCCGSKTQVPKEKLGSLWDSNLQRTPRKEKIFDTFSSKSCWIS